VGLLVGCGLLIAVAGACWWLARDIAQMDPAEHYSLRGWYAVLPLGVHGAGVLLLGLWALRGLARLGGRLLARLVRQPDPAPAP
jgi:hypothetical protein